MQNRRDFLKGIAFAGAASAAGGAAGGWWPFGGTAGSPMHGYAAPAIPHIRLGVVGMGSRGCGIVNRASKLPGITITAICDNVKEKVDKAQKMLADRKKPAAKEYLGDTAWQRLCDDPNVDVVYNTTPWSLHVPVQLAAMKGGKHVFTEVPSALTVDQCWELVETSEKTKRHCMQLENCCYGEIEMLTFNLAKLGMLGELVHGEGAYIHDLRHMCKTEWPGCECWRFDENRVHGGNRYPTHGLVPLCLTFDVNRGDRLDYLVSLESNQANFRAYMEANLAADNKRRLSKVRMADMNSTLIKTAKGKSLLIQHDVSTPRPYSRIQFVSGTKGAICDYQARGRARRHGLHHGRALGLLSPAGPAARHGRLRPRGDELPLRTDREVCGSSFARVRHPRLHARRVAHEPADGNRGHRPFEDGLRDRREEGLKDSSRRDAASRRDLSPTSSRGRGTPFRKNGRDAAPQPPRIW